MTTVAALLEHGVVTHREVLLIDGGRVEKKIYRFPAPEVRDEEDNGTAG